MVYEAMDCMAVEHYGVGGLSADALLKNVGLICDACGAGKHYDCILLTDSTKKMCLCSYTTHPYLSKEQLSIPQRITTAGDQHGKTELRTAPTPAVEGLRVQKVAPLSD